MTTVYVLDRAHKTILTSFEGPTAIVWRAAVTEVKATAHSVGASGGRGWFVDRTDDAHCFEQGGFCASDKV